MINVRFPSFTRKVPSTELPSAEITHLLYGADIDEDRAETIVEELDQDGGPVLCRIQVIDEALCHISGIDASINLYEAAELQALAASMSGLVAIDLTSLEHRVWAPIIKALIVDHTEFVALYAEPDDYRRGSDLPGAPYDLSTSRGIEPLPGFARLTRRPDDDGTFAPLLGFEGARLAHVFDQEDVDALATSPIVGSPGFRLEYPTRTYLANRDKLESARMGSRVEYARASCPFEAYHAIGRIHSRSGGKYLRVAPLGTKPHALGAILYAIQNPDLVELVYDHPVRSQGRTHGSRGVYIFEVSGFVDWLSRS